jgi:hypothetical protein
MNHPRHWPEASNRRCLYSRNRLALAAVLSGFMLGACHKQDHFIEPRTPIVQIPDPKEKDSRYQDQKHNRFCEGESESETETENLQEIAMRHAISEAEMRCLESNGIFLKMDCHQGYLDVSNVKPMNKDSNMDRLYLERFLVRKVNCTNYPDKSVVSIYLQYPHAVDEYVYRYESDIQLMEDVYRDYDDAY